MVKKHLFRISAPKFWEIHRKESKYTIHPSSGPHGLEKSVPLSVLVRNYLKYAKTSREAKKIIYSGKIEIDGIPRTDPKFPVGLMDVISIKDTDENFRVFFNEKGNLIVHKIEKGESSIKPLKIINKTILKKKRLQLNFYDGKNKIVDKDIYKTSDTMIYDLHKKAFSSHLKFEKGAIVYIMDGKKTGHIGILDSVSEQRGTEPARIVLKSGKEKFETLKDYAFVIGKEKSLISIPQENESGK
ncbi:MAG: 30S ribosomal protein S4e [Nanoarchaeota archaeon]